MKKSNKKGFTIVELVIVIAVISILSAVLIPTFSNITTKAKKSSAMQAARSALTNVIAEEGEAFGGTYYIKSTEGYWFTVSNNQFQEDSATKTAPIAMTAAAVAKVFVEDGVINDKFDIDETATEVLVDAVEIADLGEVIVYKAVA